MEDCVDLGLVKDIGGSNFNSLQLQRLLDQARIKPAINQVNCWVFIFSQILTFVDKSYEYFSV